MCFSLDNKTLYISDGIAEIRYSDLCNVLSAYKIEEICLPPSLKVIHDHTFFDFPEIKQIYIPESVKHIGTQAFWGLDNLEALTLPRTVLFVGKHAFCNCRKLKLTILGKEENLPKGWDAEFAVNIGCISFKEPKRQYYV